ncbi:MAG: hypothetical protein KY475_05755 [Planctomycetes bacterium]|nr:hypothetical protein [Planctomycetota bacterium]
MTALRLILTDGENDATIGRIGGRPELPAGSDWPRCRMCDAEMVAFIDLVLPERESSPFPSGSRLQVFQCREHSDIAGTIYSDYAAFDAASLVDALPAEYWNVTDGHYLLRLLPPGEKTSAVRVESSLAAQFILASPIENDAADGFKLFGEPYWLQDAESHTCSCGAAMKLLLQVPENLGFPMAAGAPEQQESFSKTEYCLFLGNQLYLLACTRQCHPLALWPVLQN